MPYKLADLAASSIFIYLNDGNNRILRNIGEVRESQNQIRKLTATMITSKLANI
jgi:hypothetical protein